MSDRGFDLGWLLEVLEARRSAPAAESYTRRLLDAGLPRVAQKVGEEATEVVIAALAGSGNSGEDLVGESADLLYHLLVLWMAAGIDGSAVAAELERRHRER